jgi:uncharacterized membrane protein
VYSVYLKLNITCLVCLDLEAVVKASLCNNLSVIIASGRQLRIILSLIYYVVSNYLCSLEILSVSECKLHIKLDR